MIISWFVSASENLGAIIGIIVVASVVFVSWLVFIALSFKKCPPDKIMVILGNVGNNPDGSKAAFKCVYGGVVFVIPFLQSYQFIDITPMNLDINIKRELSCEQILAKLPNTFAVGVCIKEGVMQNAAEKLLHLTQREIEWLTRDIILEQIKLVILSMGIQQINIDCDKFINTIATNINNELEKVGIWLINYGKSDNSYN